MPTPSPTLRRRLALLGPTLLLAGCSTATLGPGFTRDLAVQDQQGPAAVGSEGESNEALAKKTQNPVSDLVSLPFQNNTNFGVGPGEDTQNVLNIQPVVPVSISDDWTLINRVILPVVYQPELVAGTGSEFGLGDTNYTGFFSPKDSGSVIWGVGPSIQLPTSTDDQLGSDEWGLGASAVALTMPKPWVIGLLVNNVWSVGGSSTSDFNKMLVQPFVNYNFAGGWYLTSAPIITADWEADSSDRWVVPLGGGGGKIFRIGSQPMNFQTQAFYNVEHPRFGPDWQLRIQLQLLF